MKQVIIPIILLMMVLPLVSAVTLPTTASFYSCNNGVSGNCYDGGDNDGSDYVSWTSGQPIFYGYSFPDGLGTNSVNTTIQSNGGGGIFHLYCTDTFYNPDSYSYPEGIVADLGEFDTVGGNVKNITYVLPLNCSNSSNYVNFLVADFVYEDTYLQRAFYFADNNAPAPEPSPSPSSSPSVIYNILHASGVGISSFIMAIVPSIFIFLIIMVVVAGLVGIVVVVSQKIKTMFNSEI